MARRPQLTERQRRFVSAYRESGNAALAAVAAGFSPRLAHAQAARLLKSAAVVAALGLSEDLTPLPSPSRKGRGNKSADLKPAGPAPTRGDDGAQVTAVSPERIVAEYIRIAFSDLRDFVEWGPDGVVFKDSAALSEDQARSIAEVTETVTQYGGSKRLKLHDKKGALDSLARYLGLFVERHEHAGRQGGAIEMTGGPDLSRLNEGELRTLEALLAKTVHANGDATHDADNQPNPTRAGQAPPQ